jgi:tetratricopeptide (TPR) repeat protein
MSTSAEFLSRVLPEWVAATRRRRVSVPNTSEVYRQLEAMKSSLETSQPASTTPEDALTAMNVLSFELVCAPKASTSVLAQATSAFQLLLSLELDTNEFDEVAELRSRFAFVAWRHARKLCNTLLSQRWLELFDENFRKASVHHDCVFYFLQVEGHDRTPELNARFLSDSESLFSICAAIRDLRNSAPAALAIELPALQKWVTSHFWPAHFTDERTYFVTQLEMSRGVCARWMGDREAAMEWFRRAEKRCESTPEWEIGSAEIELARLTTEYDAGQTGAVLTRLPILQRKLELLGMTTGLVKSRLLEAVTMKREGRIVESSAILEDLLHSEMFRGNGLLRALTLESLGDSYCLLGRLDDASKCLNLAFEILREKEEPTGRAFLKLVLGEMFWIQGDSANALQAYRGAQGDYAALQLETWEAYARLLAGEVLLACGRESEAASEVLAALPTIEKRSLVREGVAAVTLLRESIRRRKMDRNALRELREQLRGKA